MTSLNDNDWYKLATTKKLTIADMLEVKEGEVLEFLVMDRNLWDVAADNNLHNVDHAPEIFFRANKATYKHHHDLKGVLTLYCDNDPIELENFEFHVEYKQDSWYPLRNGELPEADPQGIARFGFGKPKHWTEFSVDTGIGYRGPILLWSKVKDLPNINYKEMTDEEWDAMFPSRPNS